MKRFFLLCAVLIVVSGCSSVTVRRDFDPASDFSSFQTYAWKHDKQPATGNARIDNDLLDHRIRGAVENELGIKGITAVSKADADVLVAYFMDYKQRIGGSSFSFGLGGGNYGRYGGVGYNTSISDYDEAHLTIDIIDRSTGKTIWRGEGWRVTYESPSPEKSTAIVKKAVHRILAGFPPGK